MKKQQDLFILLFLIWIENVVIQILLNNFAIKEFHYHIYGIGI